ncbi:MAG: MarR family transcriptional regulator [Hyphomicrobiales bacterium]|nr:MarR family transcriptional regulator [Hyphomicrobiales bacterium]
MTQKTIHQLIRDNWPDAATAQSAWILMIQRLAALLQANARAALAPLDLTFTEFEILAVLRSSAPPHELVPSALYNAILISSGGLTKALKALETRGLVARPLRSGDRRRRPIVLTAEGRNLAEAAMRAVQCADTDRLQYAELTKAEYTRLTETLSRALSSFDDTRCR